MRKACCAVLLLVCGLCAAGIAPTDNPVKRYGLNWTDEIAWDNVVRIEDAAGVTTAEKLAAAQAVLAAKGGGVVYFSARTYTFEDSIFVADGVVLRGADPAGTVDARQEAYAPATRFEFPKYLPKFEGEGTPIATAFKGIHLMQPEAASNCGIVNIAINRGHIAFEEAAEHAAGRNRIVYGCVLRNAAAADTRVPDLKAGQHGWQRFTNRHRAAITVKAAENILIANNRLPRSGDDNFIMDNFVVQRGVLDGVVFDYDNRPGMYVNDYGIGGGGGADPKGTPETHPWGFRKGIVIRENYLYMTGRCAISFTGDGVVCADNVVRFADNVWRPTTTGTNRTTGSATNDNRAVQMRGWRWSVTGNDFIVHRNWAADRKYRINDGEGLMHEGHVNSTIKDSRLAGNRGNAYLSLYKTAGVDGLVIENNDIRTGGGIAAIYVNANRNADTHPCRNVRIVNNTTAGSGILIAGEPGEKNVIQGNRHIGGGGTIVNEAAAELADNTGYMVKGKE
ncbi:MAG: hypothetical protein IH624_07940 [Phycisphaerae bacterium]|nr:hypothetical protein [Phycisphaerae bacterium]